MNVEKNCGNCKYGMLQSIEQPCCECDESSKWESITGDRLVADERREYFAFGFAKLMLGMDKNFIAKKSVELATELIKELDK